MIQYYPLPTIADVATRLHRAKVIIELDVRNGFWHVTLDDESSFLTTFNTTFGSYCWKRMPFGIKSATEIFQCKMHEVTEGLVQVEVDEFVVVGCGITLEEGTCDHDQKRIAFLKRCQESGLKLNSEKPTLRQTEVAFIGHVAPRDGLRVDPAKFKAVLEMPAPTDKTGIQRLFGMIQFQSKFLPHLMDMTNPLRDLTKQDVEWCWGDGQDSALKQIKEAVTYTAAQMSAQIERQLLAIAFAHERFEAYIFGRDLVNVETDHKPLEAMVLKPLRAAPQHIQRMLLHLQKFNLQIKYQKGTQMFLADTLRRVHLPGQTELPQCLLLFYNVSLFSRGTK